MSLTVEDTPTERHMANVLARAKNESMHYIMRIGVDPDDQSRVAVEPI